MRLTNLITISIFSEHVSRFLCSLTVCREIYRLVTTDPFARMSLQPHKLAFYRHNLATFANCRRNETDSRSQDLAESGRRTCQTRLQTVNQMKNIFASLNLIAQYNREISWSNV